MGFAVLHGLHAIVDLHRHHACFLRNVAADHQDDAEFADGMGKCQDRAGEEARSGQRYDDRPESIPGAGAQAGRRFQGVFADGFKGVL